MIYFDDILRKSNDIIYNDIYHEGKYINGKIQIPIKEKSQFHIN